MFNETKSAHAQHGWGDFINFFLLLFSRTLADLSDVGCMSPLYATPPISPNSDTNGPNFDEQFKTSSAIFNEHFARDTHMRIILGTNKAPTKHKK